MKKLIYSKKGKGLLYIVQTILAVSCIVSLCILYLYTTITVKNSYGTYRYHINFFDVISDYEDSDYFNTMLDKHVSQTIRYAVIRSQMELDGRFDGKKIIDIEDYAKRYEASKQEYKSVPYTIEDLIKWGQFGVEYTNDNQEYVSYTPDGAESSVAKTEVVEEGMTLATESASEVAYDDESVTNTEVIINSTVSDVGEEIAVDETSNEQYYTQDGWRLIERYQSAEGKFLSDYVTDELSYDELCKYLSDTASSLAYNYTQYKNYNQMFQDNQTNLSYYIAIDKEKNKSEVYTNMNLEEGEDALSKLKEMGRYICYNSNTMEYETNTTMTEEELISEINSYDYTYSDSCKIYIGIDTQYLYQDSFMEGYKNYNKIVPWIPYLIAIAFVSFVFYVILFIVFCTVTGRSGYEEEVKLNFFDHLKTEIFLMFFLIVCGGLMALSGIVLKELYYYEIDKKTICTIAGIAVLSCHALVLVFLSSFIRRFKGHNIWNNSLVYAIGSIVWKTAKFIGEKLKITFYHIYDDSRLTARTWVPYVIFISVNFFLFQTNWIGQLFAIVMDIIVGINSFRENRAKETIMKGIEKITEGDLNYQLDTSYMHGDNLYLAKSVNQLGDGICKAVETSMKDERLKADLITNVSHDIKTPLTSIINYVDLLKRENIQDEKIKKYISILDSKSQRLKHLTEDLVEASKISSGNITLELEKINFVELIHQSIGEFYEKFAEKEMRLIAQLPDHPLIIEADSRRIWRVIENLSNNAYKYALENTRIYLDLKEEKKEDGSSFAVLSMKNISKQSLNIDASELTERFIRGDVSRSTEGSGLGLSIAKNLTELQNGKFEIYLDGDLFKVTLEFPIVN